MKTTRWVPRPPNDPPVAPDAGLHAELFVQLAAQAGLQVFVGLPVPARQERVRLPVRPDDEHVVGVANHGAGEEVGSRHRGRTRICDEEGTTAQQSPYRYATRSRSSPRPTYSDLHAVWQHWIWQYGRAALTSSPCP